MTAPTIPARTYRSPRGTALTARQTQVLALMADGHTMAAIARVLRVDYETVKSQVSCVYAKLGAANGPHAVALAFRRGVLPLAEPVAGAR